jgi:hypothetical protein
VFTLIENGIMGIENITSQLSGTKNSLLGFASLHILANNF